MAFELTREAGTLVFEGRVSRGRALGEFGFRESPDFRATMRDLGYGRLDDDEVFSAAMLDVGPVRARNMAGLGFDDLDFDELVSSAIFHIDADYLAEMSRGGFDDLDLGELISFRVFDIDAAFVEQPGHLLGVTRGREAIILARQHAFDQPTHERIVLDDQYVAL